MDMSQNAPEGAKSKKQENIEKGKMAENLFSKYLNAHGMPFYYIEQSKESFSEELHTKHIHRPDYIVHTKKGVFHIDVKYRKKQPFGPENEKRFCLDQFLIDSLFKFQNELQSVVWVAFTDDLNDSNNHNFFFASVSEIYEYLSSISEEIDKKSSKDILEKFKECLIYIPESLLYECFSFDNGFYKKPNLNFIETEAKGHIEKTKEIRDPKAIKGARINEYKKT